MIFVISLADPNHMVFVQFPDVMPGVPASYGNEEDAKSSNKDQVRQKLIALCLGQSLVKQIKKTALSM